MTNNHLAHVLKTGSIASLATTAAAGLAGQLENKSLAAPLNATSHIVWGDEAAGYDRFDLRHTAVGTLLNLGAMYMWAGVQEMLFPKTSTWRGAAAVGAGVAALAYATDYYLLPKRLTPGFEKRVSPRAVFAIFTVLAAALALGARINRAR
ncbi:MAG TPA: hypothetical protein VHO25_25160 [Polyangiaceae bacterium]|nr:hypothetical protein [Polyangiaceae bacterium]